MEPRLLTLRDGTWLLNEHFTLFPTPTNEVGLFTQIPTNETWKIQIISRNICELRFGGRNVLLPSFGPVTFFESQILSPGARL